MKNQHGTRTNRIGQLLAFTLAAMITFGGVLVPVHAAPETAHFLDVPASHWAFSYVERAYQDGALVGVGGDPAAGTGVFSPDESMTYGQLITMLVNAFYPEELARTSVEGPWYAPGIQVAVTRGIGTSPRRQNQPLADSFDKLMEDASAPVTRYDAARFLVRLLDDKLVVLPADEERKAAEASIGDWEAVVGENSEIYWAYYVSSIYAMGIMSGVDDAGTFAGTTPITRAGAAVLYTKVADRLKTSQNDPRAFQIEFVGEWDGVVPEGYQASFEEEFYTVFPRLWARWGNADVSKHITVQMTPAEEVIPGMDNVAGATYTSYDYARQIHSSHINLSIEMINRKPWGPGLLAHEMSHAATNAYPSFSGTWWIEAIADYGFFRYCSWADSKYPDGAQVYQQNEEALRLFSYDSEKPDSKMPWFLAYLDEMYPTTNAGYGLLDSLHQGMKCGRIASDGHQNQDGASFNAVIKQMTGYDNIELLRQQYIKELDTGTWTFDGFADFADNYITEGLPGVPDPDYPVKADFDLCAGAQVVRASGKNLGEAGVNSLIDRDYSTAWVESKEDVNELDDRVKDAQHWIELWFDYKSVTFNTYVLHHQGGQETTKSWILWYKDVKDGQWKKLDEVQDNTEDVTTRVVEPVMAGGLWLDILDSDQTGDGTVRLYELELFYKE